MDDMDDIVSEFLVESYENLDRLDRELVALEGNPGEYETLASIFRTIHTIKGSCAFLGFSQLEKVTHVGENLLSRLRDGELKLSPELVSGLLALVDAVRQMLSSIEATRAEGDTDFSALTRTLTALQLTTVAKAAPAAAAAASQAVDPSAAAPVQAPGPPLTLATAPLLPPSLMDEADAPDPEELRGQFGEILVNAGQVNLKEVAQAMTRQQRDGPRHIADLLVELGTPQPQQVVDALKQQAEVRSTGSNLADNSIRVDVGQLDRLMNLVGELVLARNQILQFTSTREDAAFVATSQRLNLITTELQEGVMKTRMQPIGTLWSKLPRVVRDLALSCGKQVRVEMEGRDTELDKTIIEAIKDPLMHVVRNSVDHGIEMPDTRMASGKSEEGRLFLRAYHEGGQVNIEISDDGGGIDPEKIKRKALQRSLVPVEQLARMNERELLNLIFLPGFSTAERVTNISGRGVGMDVVRTNIEKIGGAIDIQSRPGHGTTLKIKIPLTLAIIPALIITSGGEHYAIPQVNLLELLRLAGDQTSGGIEMIMGAPVYRLRGNLLPLAVLNRELTSRNAAKALVPAQEVGEVRNIVVLQAGDRQFGLVVDEINDTQEIVVKPLSKQLKGITAFAGATIMGDGRVALILDVMGLAQRARMVTQSRERSVADRLGQTTDVKDNRRTLLLLDVADQGRMAIPLSLVARLEEFPRSAVEQVGDREMVQYRGAILQLIRLTQVLPERRRELRGDFTPGDNSAGLQVVVYTERGRSLGIVVGRILDVVEESIEQQQPPSRAGVLGTVVIQNRVTQLLDLEAIIRMSDPAFFERSVA